MSNPHEGTSATDQHVTPSASRASTAAFTNVPSTEVGRPVSSGVIVPASWWEDTISVAALHEKSDNGNISCIRMKDAVGWNREVEPLTATGSGSGAMTHYDTRRMASGTLMSCSPRSGDRAAGAVVGQVENDAGGRAETVLDVDLLVAGHVGRRRRSDPRRHDEGERVDDHASTLRHGEMEYMARIL